MCERPRGQHACAPLRRPRARATCPGAKPCVRAHICSDQRGETSPQIHFSFKSNMAPTPLRHIFFVCQSAFLNSFQGKDSRRLLQTPAGGPRSPSNECGCWKTRLPQAVLLHKSSQDRPNTTAHFTFQIHCLKLLERGICNNEGTIGSTCPADKGSMLKYSDITSLCCLPS